MDQACELGEALVGLAFADLSRRRGFDEGYYRVAWLNYVGATLSGRAETSVGAFVRSRATLAPGTYAPLGRDEELTLPDCVMANCYASSAQAFDDIHFATTTHPAGPVASAVLGVAQLVPLTLGDAVSALAAGMEAECRLALALFSPKTGSAAGWYTTGIAGGVGAAVACCRLLGLTREQAASAVGWAAAAACGVRGTHGSAAGIFVPALAARAGLEAALLARDGLDCGISALVGPNGLIRQIAPCPAAGVALEGMGEVMVSQQASCKPYPFGFVAFAAIDAALGLGSVHDVGSLDLFVSERAAQLGSNPRPASADEAIVSIPYLVARTLVDPHSTTMPLTTPFAVSPQEAQVMRAIRLHADPSLADSSARIVLNGGEHESTCDVARGTAQNPLSAREVEDKFRRICGVPDPDRLVAAIMHGSDDLLMADCLYPIQVGTTR